MVEKKEKTRRIFCSHKKALRTGCYIYNLLDNNELWLCDSCNCILAEKVFGQMAIEHFSSTNTHAREHERIDESLFRIFSILQSMKKRGID